MDYKEKYEQALSRARQFSEKPLLEDSSNIVEYIFPELASEDERIRKEIIDFATKANNGVTSILANNYDFNKWLVWLEKQSEQNPITIFPKFRIGDTVKDPFGGVYHIIEINNDGYKTDDGRFILFKNEGAYTILTPAWLVKQASPVLSNSLNNGKDEDKAEPKFKVGDWITNGIETIQITGYDIDYGYQVDYKGNLQHRDTGIIEKEYHLWNIADAKDGDVLVDRYGNIGIFEKTFGFDWHSYCYLGCNGDFMYDDIGGSHDSIDTYPATKEQRDTLMKAMVDAGYMWDSENKILLSLKAEPNSEQKPAWSEEDERMMKGLTFLFDNISQNIKRDFCVISDVERDNYGNWLKSLKDRV